MQGRGRRPEWVSHYTDATGALGIIRSGTIWATDARFMNDASELMQAERVFQRKLEPWLEEFFGRPESRRAFAEGFWATFQAAATDPLYVACFCEADDLLSQWRAYASAGQGYSLRFDATKLDAWTGVGAELLKVVYEVSHRDRFARELVFNGASSAKRMRPMPRAGWIAVCREAGAVTGDLARTLAYRFKDSSFSEEQEWRLVYQAPPPSDPLHGRVEPRRREFRTGTGDRIIVPYVVLDAPPSSGLDADISTLPLNSVRIGPTANPELAMQSVRQALDDYGHRHAGVFRSAIPLRA
jgi:hypothetical protein